jgi:hypothetical protein
LTPIISRTYAAICRNSLSQFSAVASMKCPVWRYCINVTIYVCAVLTIRRRQALSVMPDVTSRAFLLVSTLRRE